MRKKNFAEEAPSLKSYGGCLTNMDRTLDPGDRSEARTPAQPARGGAASKDAVSRRVEGRSRKTRDAYPAERPEQVHADRPRAPHPSPRQREDRMQRPASGGRRVYSVSADQRQTMADVGSFRTVTTKDLVEFRYQGNTARMRQDLRSLSAQGLIQRKIVWTGRDREKETFWALTPSGKRMLKRGGSLPSGQAIYAGFVKPAELRHDAAIYRMYQRESERINKEGARIQRVVLDFELKKKAYSPLARAKALPPKEYAKRQSEIAREHGLKVVNGHIALPDLRIEYETADGTPERIDLELATASYHGSHASEKAAAGFKMYADPATAARLSAALDEREITAEILWL
jgi:hypothetical protein